MKTLYAKPKFIFEGFRKGSLYEVIKITEKEITLINPEKEIKTYPKEDFEIIESIL